ncbi:MAG: osmotically-inducible protein OsmY [Parasphingorhabdus sp.]|jgi:osmotically-inducible protein OsmY
MRHILLLLISLIGTIPARRDLHHNSFMNFSNTPLQLYKTRGSLAWRLLATSICSFYLAGCAATALGVALVTSVDIARDKRTVGTYVDDNSVEVKIRRAINRDPTIDRGVNISVTSMNGIVLLTGETPRHEQSSQAVHIARNYSEVRSVINQINISEKSRITSRSNDIWLTSKVKTRLLTTKHLRASDIKVVTERGNVYLLGMISATEGELAVNAARKVRGITRIVKVFEYQ